ncbi:hypothetical protein D3C81_1505090 [compost metagenome]
MDDGVGQQQARHGLGDGTDLVDGIGARLDVLAGMYAAKAVHGAVLAIDDGDDDARVHARARQLFRALAHGVVQYGSGQCGAAEQAKGEKSESGCHGNLVLGGPDARQCLDKMSGMSSEGYGANMKVA